MQSPRGIQPDSFIVSKNLVPWSWFFTLLPLLYTDHIRLPFKLTQSKPGSYFCKPMVWVPVARMLLTYISQTLDSLCSHQTVNLINWLSRYFVSQFSVHLYTWLPIQLPMGLKIDLDYKSGSHDVLIAQFFVCNPKVYSCRQLACAFGDVLWPLNLHCFADVEPVTRYYARCLTSTEILYPPLIYVFILL